MNGIPWQEREALLDTERLDVAWICGLPKFPKADRPDPAIEPRGAPVTRAPRDRDRPAYFSDVVVRRDPPFESRIQIVEVVGPNSGPPWVVLRRDLRALLLDMHRDPEGQAVWAGGHLACFAPVEDRDYDDIRRMTHLAGSVVL